MQTRNKSIKFKEAINSVLYVLPEEAKNIPKSLLLESMISENGKRILKAETVNKLNQQGINNNGLLKLLGGAVLNFIIVQFVYFKANDGEIGLINENLLVNSLTSDNNLYCRMQQYDLCKYLIYDDNYESIRQVCANAFRAIIGALYLYLREKRYADTINIIGDWLFDKLYFYAVYTAITESGKYICPVTKEVIIDIAERQKQALSEYQGKPYEIDKPIEPEKYPEYQEFEAEYPFVKLDMTPIEFGSFQGPQ